MRQLCRNSCDLSPQAKSEADDKGRQRRPGGPQAQHVARSDIYLTMGRTRVEERGANLCLLEMSRKTGTDIHTDRQFFKICEAASPLPKAKAGRTARLSWVVLT